MEKRCIWYNGSLWLKDRPCKIYVGQWPIFHGPLILPYIIVTVKLFLYIKKWHRPGLFVPLWSLALVIEQIHKLTFEFLCLFKVRLSNTLSILLFKGWNTLGAFFLTIDVTIEVSGVCLNITNQVIHIQIVPRILENWNYLFKDSWRGRRFLLFWRLGTNFPIHVLWWMIVIWTCHQ